MSGTTPLWEDRRGLFQRGKEVHEPGRRISQGGMGEDGLLETVRRSSMGSMPGSSMEKTRTNSSSDSAATSTSQPRRLSQTALFGNLQQHKRGSEDYQTRRASHADQNQPGGIMSGWFNATFRGMKNENSGA